MKLIRSVAFFKWHVVHFLCLPTKMPSRGWLLLVKIVHPPRHQGLTQSTEPSGQRRHVV